MTTGFGCVGREVVRRQLGPVPDGVVIERERDQLRKLGAQPNEVLLW